MLRHIKKTLERVELCHIVNEIGIENNQRRFRITTAGKTTPERVELHQIMLWYIPDRHWYLK
jgi:glycerol dehydrogenase-like iron-containing ADH family enzyme